MSRELTPSEVLQVAAEMERHAAKFYRRAAGLYHDPRLSKLFSDLAQWEKRHVQVFAEMKEHFSKQTRNGERLDLDRSAVSRPEVPPAVFHERSEPAKELTGSETRAEVIKLAIQKEHHSIGYYTILMEFALGQDNTRAIKAIIEEERMHLRILMQSLQQANG